MNCASIASRLRASRLLGSIGSIASMAEGLHASIGSSAWRIVSAGSSEHMHGSSEQMHAVRRSSRVRRSARVRSVGARPVCEHGAAPALSEAESPSEENSAVGRGAPCSREAPTDTPCESEAPCS